MKRKNALITFVAVTLCVITVVSILLFSPDSNNISKQPDLLSTLNKMSFKSNATDYDTYLSNIADKEYMENETVITVNRTVVAGETAEFTIDTDEVLANIKLTYKIISENDGDGSVSVKINGVCPFNEANEIPLKREWLSEKVTSDERGNQYTVSLSENTDYVTSYLYDNTGFHTTPLYFSFNKGENILSLKSNNGNVELKSITLDSMKDSPSYEQIKKQYGDTKASVRSLEIEGEMPYIRSNASIAESCDRSSPSTTPLFDGLQVWNCIGGSGYSNVGQYVTYKVDIADDGYYKLGFRFKNNFMSGVSVYRHLYIDGQTPFSQMQSVRFSYDSSWQNTVLTDESTNEEFLFYLTEGEHFITLEVTLGEMAQVLNTAQKSLSRLNEAYRKIVMITGASPDTYRDYQIEKKLPDMLDILKEQKAVLSDIVDWLTVQNGEKGEGTAVIEEILYQLKEFIKYPESIPESLATFSGNLSSLSDWIQSSTSQPLIIDKIELLGKNATLQKAEKPFFDRLWFNIKLFFKSFAEDYGVIGSVYNANDSTEVWLGLGRDQYQIIKEQTDNYFTKEYKTGVNLKLVTGGVLNAAIAGIAPDVYLFSDDGTPVNFASRGALLDLAKFKDYGDVAKRFSDQALLPYSYDGGVYALPLTQIFEVMFVRDDILKEIGLSVPQTWDDIYNCLTVLQQNNMEFALPSAGTANGYALLLFKDQKNFYTDNGKSVAIDTEVAINAFEEWTNLYDDYSLLQSYSFVNRFRSGDMPIGITTFDIFNTLQVSAPEISGLWSMHPVPGVKRESGEIEHISVCAGTSAIILKTAKNPQNAWEYLKWFTDEEEQYRYATAIENKQGVSGRFCTANIAAFNRLSWSSDTLGMLNLQRDSAYGIEQVPGGYFLSRHINNIFRKVINEDADVRETVLDYAKIINSELTKKRREFGLEVDG